MLTCEKWVHTCTHQWKHEENSQMQGDNNTNNSISNTNSKYYKKMRGKKIEKAIEA